MDREAIKNEIAHLVQQGTELLRRELVAHAAPEELKELKNVRAQTSRLFKTPDFGREYQAWYSPALRAVEQLLPDRYSEMRALYKDERRKEINLETYGVADYISGIQLTRSFGTEPAFDIMERAMNRFAQQIAILGTAEGRVDSILGDIARSQHAEILDNELVEARALLAARHVRSAGVVAGVVLEGHLRKLISDHKVPLRKKAMLSNLNDALKDAGVYDVPQWRRIQHLTDIRNFCGHRMEREPNGAEVDDLITETAKIIKTVF
jgi:hypothetical protein